MAFFCLLHLVGIFQRKVIIAPREGTMRIATIAALCCAVLCLAWGASASETVLIDSGICTGVVNHDAVGTGEVFDREVGKLFCFTRVVGPYLEEKKTYVQHVWYYKNTERARVTLPVKSSNWGTYSSKNIQTSEIGDWRVEVLDSQGEAIQVFQFFIRE
jgi:hypothetical protein